MCRAEVSELEGETFTFTVHGCPSPVAAARTVLRELGDFRHMVLAVFRNKSGYRVRVLVEGVGLLNMSYTPEGGDGTGKVVVRIPLQNLILFGKIK